MESSSLIKDHALDTRAQYVGRMVREAREGKGWSRMQLIRRLAAPISERTLFEIEHGLTKRPLPSTVALLEKALKIRIQDD